MDELDSVSSPSISIVIAHWHDDCEIITTGRTSRIARVLTELIVQVAFANKTRLPLSIIRIAVFLRHY